MYLFIKLSVVIVFSFFIMIVIILNNHSNEKLPIYEITLKDHHFQPDRLEVRKNKKIRLNITNEDKNLEEFESIDLRKERILPPLSETSIIIGPLSPGEYKYYGEFNPDIAKGVVIVK